MASLLLVGILATMLPQAGTPITHEGVKFETPKGWTATKGDRIYLLAPNAMKDPDFFLVAMTGALSLNGKTPESTMSDFMKGLNKDVKVIDPGSPSKTLKQGATFINQATEVQDKAGETSFRIAYMMAKGTQYVMTTTFTNKQSAFEKVLDDWVGIHSSLMLAAPVTPRPAQGNSKPSPGKITKTPTGNAQGYFPGMPDWVPSGTGTTIPASKLVNGKPQGLWYEFGSGGTNVRCFLADGTVIDYIIYGSGTTVDITSHKGNNPTSVGTIGISGGKINYKMDGKSWSYNYKTGSDAAGPFFSENGGPWRPTRPLKVGEINGLWRNGSTQYLFNSDGTFKFGQGVSGSVNGVDWVESSTVTGPYLVDGYLLTTRDNVGHQIVQGVMYGTSKFIILNDMAYVKVK
jgi:hypothetical protein